MIAHALIPLGAVLGPIVLMLAAMFTATRTYRKDPS